jgi:type IV pilus assembly protein PilM
MLGIDITTTSVHILEVSASSDNCCVQGYCSITLPENVIEGSLVKDIDLAASTIRKALIENRIATKSTAIAVPDSIAISKIIQVNEGLTEEEIEELIAMESDKHIPYPIDEINLDFNILGPSAKNTAMIDVLLVASRAENVNNRVEVITKAGLEPGIVDVESYAIERTLQRYAANFSDDGVKKNIAIIDIGSSFSKFYVFHNSKIIFSREEDFGGMQLVEAVKQRFNLERDAAFMAIENNTLPPEYELEVLQPFKEQILLHVKRAIQLFYSNSQQTYVDHLLIGGGVAKLPGLAFLIQEHVNIPTSVANPFESMEQASKIKDQIMENAPRLLVACGLAIRVCR